MERPGLRDAGATFRAEGASVPPAEEGGGPFSAEADQPRLAERDEGPVAPAEDDVVEDLDLEDSPGLD